VHPHVLSPSLVVIADTPSPSLRSMISTEHRTEYCCTTSVDNVDIKHQLLGTYVEAEALIDSRRPVQQLLAAQRLHATHNAELQVLTRRFQFVVVRDIARQQLAPDGFHVESKRNARSNLLTRYLGLDAIDHGPAWMLLVLRSELQRELRCHRVATDRQHVQLVRVAVGGIGSIRVEHSPIAVVLLVELVACFLGSQSNKVVGCTRFRHDPAEILIRQRIER
jgi:hypothetical protein